jgi:3-oxoacyl-[acyl-carrier-protein] synthase II
MRRRIHVPRPITYITGLGTANPLGCDFATTAKRLFEGKSCVESVHLFDVSQHPSQIAAQISTIPKPSDFDETDFRNRSRLEQLAVWCTTQALRASGHWETRDSLKIGLVLGLGAECMWSWEDSMHHGGKRIHSPNADKLPLIDSVKQQLGLRGPTLTVAAACASGNHALAQGRRWIELGWVDVCLAGACDLGVTPLSLAAFGNLRALSRRNDHPTKASRPFDRDRDGFVMGEGGAVFVLESADRARKRGALIHGEIAGFGASSDASHLVIPSTDPTPAVTAMRHALHDAAISADDIDYINAHATSTPVGDKSETRVLQTVLGEAVRRVPVSSTKSMTGHLVTAAAAFEALACLAALQHGVFPPTINLENIDPECELLHIPNQPMERKAKVAVSNSFGFGGSNTCLVLRKVA